mmetsp:Transcript_152381/g.387167  ORF Transcript_152381/g.387167 Transcript_152381/m.387167 type:complete len:445 (-) Transcript_152381:663-1997(-)
MARQEQYPQRSQTRSGPSTGRPTQQRRRATMADSATQEDQCHPRKIFVGGLAHKTSTQGLRDHFQRYGPVVDAVVLRWPDGRSRGFGYVTFADVPSASAALQDAHQIAGREVDVKRAVPGTNKLFVGGLPQNTAAAELRQHFESFGVVSDAVVMIDPSTNRSRGFGFVCFLPGQEGAAAVAAALDQYQNHRIRGKWIEVKSAAPPHKLAAKGSQDSSPTSDLSPEEAAALNAPNPGFQHLAAPPGLAHVSCSVVEHEPQKIALYGMTPALDRTSNPQVAPKTADMSTTPPGLHAPSDPTNAAAGMWQPEIGHHPRSRAHGPMGAPANLSWPPAYSPDELGTNALLTTPGSMWSGHRNAAKQVNQPIKIGDSAQKDLSAESLDQSSDGYFDASRDLQRSLEQLLRLQSEQAKAKLESQTLQSTSTSMLLPSVPADDVITMTKVER